MVEWWRRFGEFYLAGGQIERLDALADEEAEAAWKLLDLAPGAHVVDAPCGFGRHSVRLATWGFDVWGIDVDRQLLDEARKRARESGVDIHLDEGDVRNLPVPDAWADAVLNLASSIGLFDTDVDNFSVFTEAHRVLRPGGTFLIETTHRDREVQPGRESTLGERTDGTLVLERRDFDATTGRLDTKLTVIDASGARTEMTQRPRIYAITELATELHRAGFAEVDCYGGWKRERPTPDARVILLAHKA